MLLTGFLLILVVDALMLLAADNITNGDLTVDSFWSALGVALVAAAVGVILDAVAGSNDDDTYTFRVIQRIARAGAKRFPTDAPGIVFLEIDGLALPVLQPGDARRQRAEHGALAHRRHARARRVGDRPLVADGSEPGGDPARLERGHSGVPLGGEGDRRR